MECPIKNDFHNSAEGCTLYLDDNTNQYFHRFYKTNCSITTNGTPLIKLFNLAKYNSITVKFPINSLKAQVDHGPLLHKSNFNTKMQISLENYINSDNLKTFLYNTFIDFQNVKYHDSTTGIDYLMQIKCFFDMYFCYDPNTNLYQSVWFRPIHFAADSSLLYANWRDAIIRLLKICNSKNAAAGLELQNPLKRKNVKLCSLESFIAKSPQHIRCPEYIRETNKICSHLIHFYIDDLDLEKLSDESEKKILQHLKSSSSSSSSLVLCSRVLKIIYKTKNQQIMSMLNYKCRISEYSKITTKIFGRKDLLHSILCCPTILINNTYKDSLASLFVV